MSSMTELRPAIICLFEQGKSRKKLLNVPARAAQEVIKCFKETGNYNDRPRSGRPRTARTPANKRKIKGRIQRNRSSRKNSTRKLGKDLGISKDTVHQIPQEVIDRAVDDFPKCLKKCIEAEVAILKINRYIMLLLLFIVGFCINFY